ncbi:alpha/beta hydrolase [Actinomadura algeriensis]|uniref:Acetyl esterase n=1 Tax=Actinomadura algeriensis TaxID=1679523 RepID=A0ABR9K189_9ACTN|nr:alpha/beta hydrolase [Actinomadura algeriensis]MBE1536296.1 acetyl esterase [Actinomadura algeriensis]
MFRRTPEGFMGRDPQYLAFMRARLAAARDGSPADGAAGRRRSVAEARREHAADLARCPRVPVGAVADVTVDGAAGPLPARLYRPAGAAPRPGPLLVYFHGGGWVLGDVDSYDPVVRALVAASGLAWLSVGYRRPPEHRFPAPLDDAVAAVRWAVRHAAALGLDARRVGVAGDSAGGQLAAAAAGVLRGAAAARPAVQVLLYPALDLRAEPPPLPDPDGLDTAGGSVGAALRMYLGDADRTRPRVSPLLDPDPGSLPPAVIATAEFDRLRPQAERHAARLAAAGVPVAVVPGTGLDHGFLGWGSFARRPARAIAEIGAAVRGALA